MIIITHHNFEITMEKQLFPIEKQKNLGSHLHAQIMEISDGIELDLPTRSCLRAAPDFFNRK